MSTARTAVVRAIEDCGIVGIIRMKDPARLPRVVEALAEGGVRALEITMTVPGAVELIRQTASSLPAGFLLGAGTVLDVETARRVIEAGARFIVSPVIRVELIDAAHHHDVPILPGCFTPTEILTAWDAGADIVKVFPATALGPTYLRDIHGPLPQVKLMPTGGVSVENAGDWIRAGAVAVGVGSALLDAAAVASGDYGSVLDRARRIVQNVNAARAPAVGTR
jgi:2-dehydro-3-deoxyphosphogluconate aldolase/(4S)-4-hydroxy-2-oxoglutarate aldolase